MVTIDLTFAFALTHTSGDPLKTNRIGIYSEDEPYEPVSAMYAQATSTWEMNGKFSYIANRVIDRIHIMVSYCY